MFLEFDFLALCKVMVNGNEVAHFSTTLDNPVNSDKLSRAMWSRMEKQF